MRRHHVIVVAAIMAAAAGCSASEPSSDSDETAPASTEDAIIGGHTATKDEFPATVQLRDGCTAAKIAPQRLLTAAHCMFDAATTSVRYPPGSKLAIARDPSEGWTEIEVAKVHVHDVWTRACEASYCGASSMTAKLDAADVAVIDLAKDIPEISVAPIDTTPLVPGDRVSVVGFGCTKGVLVGAEENAVPILKWGDARVVSSDRALHDGSAVQKSEQAIFSGNYAMTLGPGASNSAAATAATGSANVGICPGDSGGPLYSRRNGVLAVVGVNANYTFKPDSVDAVGLPVTNWHTRLDDASRHRIGAWLRALPPPAAR